MADTKWTNLNGGDWHTAANWDNGVPDQTKRAIIDGASFNANGKSITLSALAECAGMDLSGSDQLFTIQSSVYELHLYGDYNGSTNCTFAMTGTAYVRSKSTQIPTTNGQILNWNRWYIDCPGGTVTNADELILGTVAIYLANGEWNTNDKHVKTSLSFILDYGTKSLTAGSNLLELGSISMGSVQSTGFTVNSGTSTIKCTGNSSFRAGTWYNVEWEFSGNATLALISGPVFNNLTAHGRNIQVFSSLAFTVNGVLTLTGYDAGNKLLLYGVTEGNTYRVVSASNSFSNVDIRDIKGEGSASWDFGTQTDIGDAGGNTDITFPAATTQTWAGVTGSVSDATKWTSRVPLLQDSAVAPAGWTGVITMDCLRIGSIDLCACDQAVEWKLANAITCYGHYVLGSNVTQSGNFALTLAGRGSYNLNTYSKTIYRLLQISPNGFYTNLSNIHTSLIEAPDVFIQKGTFDINDYDINCNYFNKQTEAIVYAGNGTIYLYRNSATIFFAPGVGNFIFEGGTIKSIPISGSSDISFFGGDHAFNRVIFSGAHIGNFIITGSNTFGHLEVEPSRKLQVTAGTTQTVAIS